MKIVLNTADIKHESYLKRIFKCVDVKYYYFSITDNHFITSKEPKIIKGN